MSNNMFVGWENIEQKQPIFNIDELEYNNLLKPYSNMNLGISSEQTSFIPTNIYDTILGNLSTDTKYQTTQFNNTQQNTKVSASDRRKYVKSWLIKNEGLSNEQASALTGVWFAESRLDPSIHEIGKENNPYAGKGIAQWTGKARQKHIEDIYKRIYGKSKPIKQMSLDEQLKVAVEEFKERTGNWNNFKSSKDIKTATDIVWRGYENGGNNKLATMQQMNSAYRSPSIVQKQWQDRFRFANEISKI